MKNLISLLAIALMLMSVQLAHATAIPPILDTVSMSGTWSGQVSQTLGGTTTASSGTWSLSFDIPSSFTPSTIKISNFDFVLNSSPVTSASEANFRFMNFNPGNTLLPYPMNVKNTSEFVLSNPNNSSQSATVLTSFIVGTDTGVYNVLQGSGTVLISGAFSPPISFTDGTTITPFDPYLTGFNGNGNISVYTCEVSCGQIPASTPEPATWLLFGSGLMGISFLMLRKKSFSV